jgi:hypothetical protein
MAITIQQKLLFAILQQKQTEILADERTIFSRIFWIGDGHRNAENRNKSKYQIENREYHFEN